MKKNLSHLIILITLNLFIMVSCYTTFDSKNSTQNFSSNNNVVIHDTLFSLINSQNCDTIIILNRSGCYGTCPTFDLAILSNGKVYFNGIRFVKKIGVSDSSFNKNNLYKLLSIIDKTGFMNLKDNYNLNNCNGYLDGSNIRITLKIKNISKSVSYYMGCKDYKKEREIMISLAENIEELSEIKNWIN